MSKTSRGEPHLTPAPDAPSGFGSDPVAFGGVRGAPQEWPRGGVGERSRPLDAALFEIVLEPAGSTLARARRRNEALEALATEFGQVAKSLSALSGRVHRFSVPVNALPRAEYRLRRAPVWISVEQDGDAFVAELPEVGAVGYGDTVADAVESALDCMCEIFQEVESEPMDRLGPRPRGWKFALADLVERRDGQDVSG